MQSFTIARPAVLWSYRSLMAAAKAGTLTTGTTYGVDGGDGHWGLYQAERPGKMPRLLWSITPAGYCY